MKLKNVATVFYINLHFPKNPDVIQRNLLQFWIQHTWNELVHISKFDAIIWKVKCVAWCN